MLTVGRSLVLVLTLAACSDVVAPIEPVWGKQTCDSCRMLVSEPAYAAQLLDSHGRHRLFDDLGCLDAYLVERPEHAPRALWVRSGSRWIDARSARYAAGASTPMAYGFVPDPQGTLDFSAVRRGASARRGAERP